MLPRNLRPIRLSRPIEPFDSDQFILELKIDGFRALAHIEAGQGQLISRNGNLFRGFADLAAWIAEDLAVPADSGARFASQLLQSCREISTLVKSHLGSRFQVVAGTEPTPPTRVT